MITKYLTSMASSYFFAVDQETRGIWIDHENIVKILRSLYTSKIASEIVDGKKQGHQTWSMLFFKYFSIFIKIVLRMSDWIKYISD